MHPVIAALAFIFSPSDDWLLKRAYELYLNNDNVPAVVQDYDQIVKKFPSQELDEFNQIHSADMPAMVAWSEFLHSNRFFEEAQNLRIRLLKNPALSSDLSDDLHLRMGESALLESNIAEAEKEFQLVLSHQGPRAVDAQIDLLIVALAKEDSAEAVRIADDLKHALGPLVEGSRAIFPLGLLAYSEKNYNEAVAQLSKLESEPRAQYFLGLTYRQMNQPLAALTQWQKIRHDHPHSQWNELAQFQVAETYFHQGDDNLSRLACEKALETNPKLSREFIFRLASLDMRHGDYAKALARLEDVPMEGRLAERANVVTAESLVKLGRSGDMFKAIAKKIPEKSTPLSAYQTAWAQAFDQDYERSFDLAEKGLQDFYDPEVTPRLLLLQSMASEHMGAVAEALATYQTIVDRFPQTASAAQSVDWLTRSYLRLGRTREAVTHAGSLWANLPKESKRDHPDAAFWLAEAHTRLGRLENASQLYTDYLAMAKPADKLVPYAQFQEAMVLAQLDQTGAAVAQLNDFLKSADRVKNPDWIELAKVQKGNFLFNSRQYPEAVVAYRASTSTPKAIYYEGLALAQMEYFTDAIEAWGKLARAYPQDTFAEQALFRVGRTYFELGKATAAADAFAFYIEKYPDSPKRKDALLQSAHALYNAGLYAQATPLYQSYLTAYQTTDDLVSVTPYLAACAVQTGKTLDETEALLKGLPPADALASLRWESGAKSYNEKDFPKAHDTFGRLLTDFPTDSHSQEAEFFRGESLFLAQQWQDAEGAFTNFLSMNGDEKSPHIPVAQFHKGTSLYQQDKLLAAAKIFESLVQTYPSDPIVNDAKNNLILCYHSLGQFEKRDEMKAKYGEPVFTPQPVSPATPENNSPDPAAVAQKQKTKKGLYLVEKDKLPFVKQETKSNVADSRVEETPPEQTPQ